VFKSALQLESYISLLDNDLVPFTMYPECKECHVAKGYQNGADSVFPKILAEVLRLQDEKPNYTKVAMTG